MSDTAAAQEVERLRVPRREDESTALTYSFASGDGSVCGFARFGVSAGPLASALAVVFLDGEPQALASQGAIPVADPSWEDFAAAGLSTTTQTPLSRWRVVFAGDGPELDLAFTAAGPPAGALGDDPLARAGGMESYDQPCAVEGQIGERRVSGGGVRSHAWGAPDWRKLDSVRTVTAWCGRELALSLTAARPRKAKGHQHDGSWATVWQQGAPVPIDEPRLSTTYDPDGRQRRASLELWPESDEAWPVRASGHVLCGSSLDLGDLRLECAFFRWSVDGRPGVGRYDLLRHA